MAILESIFDITYLSIVIALGIRLLIVQSREAKSFTTLLMGLIAGVFYREFIKFYHYQNITHLSRLHVHILVLGFLTILVAYIIVRKYSTSILISLKKPLYIYMVGFTFTIVNMMVFGIYEVVSISNGQDTIRIAALSGTSGIGHILLSIGIVWFMVNLFRIESNKTGSV